MQRPWIVYVRVSDEDQVRGLSLEAQRDSCIAFLRSVVGLVPHEVVEEPGFSAYGDDAIKKRPQMRRLIARIEARDVAGVVGWKTDRIARSLYDLLWFVKLLREHDGKLLCVTDQVSSDGPQGALMLQFHGMMAEHSSRQTGDRVKASFAKKIERGEWIGGSVPVGCRVVGEEGRRRLERDETTGPIVERAWTMIAEGSTLAEVGAYLLLHGLRPYNGSRRRAGQPRLDKPWTKQAVLNLLRAKAVVGVLVDVHRRDLALAALATRYAPGKRPDGTRTMTRCGPGSDRIWRLARIATCAACGSALVGIHAGRAGAMHPYLRCSGKVKSREICTALDLPAKTWEDAAVKALIATVAEGGTLVDQLGAELRTRRKAAGDLQARRAELARNRDAVTERIGRVAMLVADGDAAAEAVRPTLVKLQGELVAVGKLLSAVEGELHAAQMTAGELEQLLATIRGNIEGLLEKPLDHQAAIIATLVAEVRLGADRPIYLTLWWDDRLLVGQSALAPRSRLDTNARTVSIEVPVTRMRVPASAAGGCRWEVVLAPSAFAAERRPG